MTARACLQLLRIEALAATAEAAGSGWLTAAERARLAALHAPARRASFLAGHWQARVLAAQWLQLDMHRITLDAGADGRPRLRVDEASAPLHVSLSHSGDWLALALAETPVGIDIELPQRTRDWLALARFVFSEAETRRLQALEGAARAELFHQLWTLKEARGKRSGEGLQPRAARAVTAQACAAECAEATSWAFGEGALALALAPGARVDFSGAAVAASLGAATHWRYQAHALSGNR